MFLLKENESNLVYSPFFVKILYILVVINESSSIIFTLGMLFVIRAIWVSFIINCC